MKYALLFGSLLLSACASTPSAPVSLASPQALRGKTIALSNRPPAPILEMEDSKVTFTKAGPGIQVNPDTSGDRGPTLGQEYGIDDPSKLLGQQLIAEAVDHLGLVAAIPSSIAVDTKDVATPALAAAHADLLLDVRSIETGIRYVHYRRSGYAVVSSFKLRLIDVHSAKLIAEDFCHQTTWKDHDPPSQDELFADRAARLKATLAAQRDACFGQFKKHVFGVT